MIDDPEVEAVSICAPNFLHREMALAAAAAGKHFWGEKPLGALPADTIEIARAAEAAGVRTIVGLNYRNPPAVQHARQLIADGELGEVNHFRMQFIASYSANPRGALSWRFSRELSGHGILSDLGSHAIDLAMFLCGPIVRATATSAILIPERPKVQMGTGTHFSVVEGDVELGPVENEDWCAALVEFESGLKGRSSCRASIVGAEARYWFEVNGTRGAVAWNFERMNELERYQDGGSAPRVDGALASGLRAVPARAGNPDGLRRPEGDRGVSVPPVDRRRAAARARRARDRRDGARARRDRPLVRVRALGGRAGGRLGQVRRRLAAEGGGDSVGHRAEDGLARADRLAERGGVASTRGWAKSGWAGSGGSSSKTSRPTPPRRPFSSAASRSSCEETSAPARGVDEDEARLRTGEELRPDEPARLRGQGRVERDDVRVLEQRVERRGRVVDERVVREDVHAEAAAEVGELAPDAPEPDDAERRPAGVPISSRSRASQSRVATAAPSSGSRFSSASASVSAPSATARAFAPGVTTTGIRAREPPRRRPGRRRRRSARSPAAWAQRPGRPRSGRRRRAR